MLMLNFILPMAAILLGYYVEEANGDGVQQVDGNNNNCNNAMKDYGDVIPLDDNNFKCELTKCEFAMVLFSTTWCHFCIDMWPGYKNAATTLKNNNPQVFLFKIDCDDSKKTCDKYGVTGFPTLKVFKEGHFVIDYQSADRSEANIVQYMQYHAKHHYKPPPGTPPKQCSNEV